MNNIKCFKYLCLPILVVSFILISATQLFALEFTKKPYLQHVTKTSIIICWETDEPIAGTIKYGDTKSLGNVAESTEKDTFHEVQLEELKAETQYFFQVEAGDLSHKGKFKTAPHAGTPFRVVVYGDFRVGPVETELNKKIAREKPDLIVTVGDYISDGTKPGLWPPLFRTIGPLIRRAPYYVSLGNHEKNGPLYFKYFAMPGNERWYSFDYGNIHFIALDSNSPFRYEPAQKTWLKKDLAAARANPDTPFIFVYFHHPPYGTGKRHGDPELAKLWVPIFEKYQVDALFLGHEHHYERNVVNDIPYIITGGGGASIYEFKYEEPYSVVRAARFQYMVLDVEKDVVHVKSVALEGDVLDEFDITPRQINNK